MYYTKLKCVSRVFILLTITGLALQPISVARASDPPELPAECGSIQLSADSKLACHAYARGVQIYRWNGTAWDFVAPRATLFAEPSYFGEVGDHYAGPSWESKSGSKVIAQRVQGTGCTPDATAVAWLLLEKVSTSGAGILKGSPITEGIQQQRASMMDALRY